MIAHGHQVSNKGRYPGRRWASQLKAEGFRLVWIKRDGDKLTIRAKAGAEEVLTVQK